MKLVSLLAVTLLVAVPARATEPMSDRVVDLAPVGLPIILDGRVVNYVFLNVRLQLRPGADSSRVRDREPYFRDLLVRVAHRMPFSRPGDPLHLDEGRIRTVLLQAAPGLVGPERVEGVEIVRQTPQHRTGLPRLSAGSRSIIP